ncbi:NUDIX hydrolase [Paroceanicella profunda]|uniref:NUDIX hydrolase n=1 Tax=Paroceanicella profunda TaxID=2579971 RepID=A0A5B8FQ63_9RHOB|nr:NUDIX hydrolase [Paroceanicella profunda]QDL90736.1 NUDIX hydrolase [Paroceanicella profunda]
MTSPTDIPPPALPDKTAIRDAASVVIVRRGEAGARILMGKRGAGAAFMPSLFVFPGGAIDPADAALALDTPLAPGSAQRLGADAPGGIGTALARTAVREMFEETGLALGRPHPAARAAAEAAPAPWQPFLARGLMPATDALRFIFRAVTPKGRPRRFDARFFLVDAREIDGDPDDFSRAEDELSDLTWLDFAAARRLQMPFITEIVLAEVAAILRDDTADRPVPYFHHDDERSWFRAL